MVATAKIFRNGASQAVRLPKSFRFQGNEVCLKRIGSAVLIYPKGKAWELMAEAMGKVDEDFMANRDQPARTDRRKRL
jgi:antitoxin VapB